MPEGDTVHNAARRVGAALVGKEILALETPQPRHALDRWPQRLAGRRVRSVEARGKHMLVRFDCGLTLHSHLRMGGSWRVFRLGERWRRSPRRAWLVIRTPEHEVVQFDGPVLELLTDARARSDPRIASLGPDIVAAGEFDEVAFLGRLREDDQTRPFGDALLDQRNVAGIGNIWKSEACFMAGVDPSRALGDVRDEEALAAVRAARPLMRLSAERGRIATWRPERPSAAAAGRDWVYDRAGRPCRRCGAPIAARRQGEAGRTTFWCPRCQS
ncbi:MAG: Fpg/Nei family DNA glycosylase [Thermoleophilaceae bacterium]|nr:Fpg/Nei family DNA glycosylase [Thermoleophilaceae bacterium]